MALVAISQIWGVKVKWVSNFTLKILSVWLCGMREFLKSGPDVGRIGDFRSEEDGVRFWGRNRKQLLIQVGVNCLPGES